MGPQHMLSGPSVRFVVRIRQRTGTCGLEAEAADCQVRAGRRRLLLLLHARHQLPQHAQQVPAAVCTACGGG